MQSLRDSHEDEEMCMEYKVASDVYREGAVSYNKSQSAEKLEGVTSKLNDQVAENLVSVKPNNPNEGITDEETSSVERSHFIVGKSHVAHNCL
jgi:hypothetical protein